MRALFRIAKYGLFVLPVASAMAAPMGYSVNSDEPQGDSLYRINLANGNETEIGLVQSLGETRTDIEGLAFDKSGTLWGVDDESLKLFPISTATGQANFQKEVGITGLGAIQGNDFGLTFTCQDEIFVTTVGTESLYRLTLDGTATLVGNMGKRISAIAAHGNPARLYGLGNGKVGQDGPNDNRSLYEIDPQNGNLTKIGKIGNNAGDYFEAGLSFDAEGKLWAITDRRTTEQNLGSQVFTLNMNNGKGTLESTTSVTGFESLAVASPSGCAAPPPPPGDGDTGFLRPTGIPTLGNEGRILAILILSLFGCAAIRRQ